MPELKRDKHPADGSLAASVFEEYADELHRFLRRRVGSAEDAEDVFQTVFERVIKIQKTEFVRQPHNYVFGIAFHVVREFWIRTRRDQVVTFDSVAVSQADRSLEHASPDDTVERLNLRGQLETALASLPESHRMILLAVKRDGMSYEEASRATGISEHMVHKILVQARAKIVAMTWDR